jgi:hypothetical protein
MQNAEFSAREGYNAAGESEYRMGFSEYFQTLNDAQIDDLPQDEYDLAVSLGLIKTCPCEICGYDN